LNAVSGTEGIIRSLRKKQVSKLLLLLFNFNLVDTQWQYGTFTHKQYTEYRGRNTHNNYKKKNNYKEKIGKYIGKCGPCPVFANYTLAFALQLRKKHGITSVRENVKNLPRLHAQLEWQIRSAFLRDFCDSAFLCS
jgi:hypothetical protein